MERVRRFALGNALLVRGPAWHNRPSSRVRAVDAAIPAAAAEAGAETAVCVILRRQRRRGNRDAREGNQAEGRKFHG